MYVILRNMSIWPPTWKLNSTKLIYIWINCFTINRSTINPNSEILIVVDGDDDDDGSGGSGGDMVLKLSVCVCTELVIFTQEINNFPYWTVSSAQSIL